MRNLMLTALLVLTVPILLLAATPVPDRVPATTFTPLLTGAETVDAPVVAPPYADLPQLDNVDLVGDTFMIGTTWYENQANGTIGRQIVKDSTNYLHFVWTNGLNSGAVNRHVFYNYIQPNGTTQGWPGVGIQVDAGIRGGFTNLDVAYQGIAFPAFHQTTSTGPILHSALANDIAPHTGAFLTWPLAISNPMDSLIWPRMQAGRNGHLNFISTQSTAAAGAVQCQYFASPTYDPSTFTIVYTAPPWTFVDSTITIAADVAASSVSNKMAYVWTRMRPNILGAGYNQYNNDIYYLIDADGLNPNFAAKINLTQFIPPDPSLLPDTLHANRDTLRAYTDANAFFDNSDYLHIAFTTAGYYSFQSSFTPAYSLIWHWSEQFPTEFKLVANGWYPAYAVPGAWRRNVGRPSMAQAANGNLYCSWNQMDQNPNAISQGGFPSEEVYISVSTDGGHNWSVGTNVTGTVTGSAAPPGSCWSELDPTMAKKVDTYCHLTYVLDKDAGNVLQTEGTWTLNPVKYHRVPVASIPTTPLLPQNIPLHVSTAAMDINIAPIGTIVIPGTGGSFQYTMNVHNLTTTPQTFAVWTKIRSGSTYYAGFGPATRTLPGGANPTRTFTQTVAGSIPGGTLYYIAYIGTYPSTIQDSSFFTFTKTTPPGNGPWISESKLYGNFFEEYADVATNPATFALLGNYPDPFNPTTTINFSLANSGNVKLSVYDVSGREVAMLVDGYRNAGPQNVTFDGTGLASGVYLYRLISSDQVATGKMVLMK